jgi:CubicO group peptidase (beta-lactamase class C family)
MRDTPRSRRRGRFPGRVEFLIGCLLVSSCAVATHGYSYRVPEQTGDGWQTASLEDVGMDTGRMVDLMNDLSDHPDHWVHGIVVIKDGKLVFEEYFPGEDMDLSDLANGIAFAHHDFDRNTLHSAASVSKSVTSVLLGIAIDDGLVQGTQQTMFSYFPDYAQLSDATKNQITLQQMLTMTSGLPWNESSSYDDPQNDLVAMVASDDPIRYVLSKSTVATPGVQFTYNSGTANLVGEIVRRASGGTLASFAAQHLFGPLGIESYEWYGFPHAPAMMVASSTLYLRPRDMAKIGQLYLDGGVWNGTRVVSAEWISRSTQESVASVESPVPALNPRYGFLWWLGTFTTGHTGTYFAAGFGGQFIFVLPELEMVVVFTAGGFQDANYDPVLQAMNQYVLPAAGR